MLELMERSLAPKYLEALKEHKSWDMLTRALNKAKDTLITISPSEEDESKKKTDQIIFETKGAATIIIHLDQ